MPTCYRHYSSLFIRESTVVAMADVVPRTPTPASRSSKAALASPPPLSSSDLTPPPSTQAPSKPTPTAGDRQTSPPFSTRPAPHDRHEPWRGPLPSTEEINRLPEVQMRDLLHDIIPALGESRMALAHTKLQLNLLQIETAEAAQRAEAEHDLTRREVEVLQAGSPDMQNRIALQPDPRSPLAQVQRHLETSISQSRELEVESFHLQRRLKQAKKVIKHLDGRNNQLSEDNHRLRDRIKQNREHFNELRQSSIPPASESPSQRKTPTARSRNPLDALLMADQILSADPSSLPSTPSPHRGLRYPGHTRGTHSLSSLPTTPLRHRLTTDDPLRTPINQIVSISQAASYSAPATHHPSRERPRQDRDSTISASEDEALTDQDIPASQASQAASNMLRRYPGPPSQESPARGKQERLVQKGLVGKVTKGHRKASQPEGPDVEGPPSKKRARVDNRNVGLGIGMWPSPQR